MREVEAQPRGLHDAAGLLHMRAEHVAQRGVQQMRRRVIAHRRHAACRGSTTRRMTDRLLAIGATVRTRWTFRPLHRRIRAVDVRELVARLRRSKRALIADLSAGFGVERRLIEDELGLDTGRQFVNRAC